jgi:hypothetical protein
LVEGRAVEEEEEAGLSIGIEEVLHEEARGEVPRIGESGPRRHLISTLTDSGREVGETL